MKKILQKGFTLVELLIVIALIAILSVAVLSTINPIEQSNKARDSRVQNDAAEVLNAMERYYASKQMYPWVEFTGGAAPLTSSDPVTLRSDTYGFGVCSDAADADTLRANDATAAVANDCVTGPYTNYLIQTSELKSSFIGKDEFEPVRMAGGKPEQAMWVVKSDSSDSIYLCYIPKAKANRDDTTKMRCINGASGLVVKPVVGAGAAACDPANVVEWGTPVLDGTLAMFKCVPE